VPSISGDWPEILIVSVMTHWHLPTSIGETMKQQKTKKFETQPKIPKRQFPQPHPPASKKHLGLRPTSLVDRLNTPVIPRYLLSLTLICALFFIHTGLGRSFAPSFSVCCILPRGISGVFPSCSNTGSYEAIVGQKVDQDDRPKSAKTDAMIFTSILDEDTLDEHALVLEIIQAKASTKDILTLVRISNLNSKTTVAALLVELAEDLKKAGRDLQRFASKVRGLDDRLVRLTYRVL